MKKRAKLPGPPPKTAWIWTTREVVLRRRTLGINARRLLDFLELEQMKHAGWKNGQLLAPRAQLEEVGIGRQYISDAIDELKNSGLILVRYGRGRQPSLYTLVWLPVSEILSGSERNPIDDAEGDTNVIHDGFDSGIRTGPANVAGYEGNHQGDTKVTHKSRSGIRTGPAKQDVVGIRR